MKDLEQQLRSDAKPEKPQCAPHRTRENIFSAEDEGLRAAEDEREQKRFRALSAKSSRDCLLEVLRETRLPPDHPKQRCRTQRLPHQ